MFKLNYVFFCILIIMLSLCCKSSQNIEEYDIVSIFQKKIKEFPSDKGYVDFNLCSEIKVDWNKIIILPPYFNEDAIKDLKLTNLGDFRSVYSNISANDGVCILLFLKGNRIIKYSVLPRSVVDVSNFKTNGTTLAIIQPKDCDHIKLKKNRDIITLSF